MDRSAKMTWLGVLGAMLAFGLIDTPPFVPEWGVWLMGLGNAGVVFYLGKTNNGKGQVLGPSR